MILSFGDRGTEDLYHGHSTRQARRFPTEIVPATLRKLDMLSAAQDLIDLRSPPGNRLEALKGERGGFYSIRINDQWRMVFRWQPNGAAQVSIVDYH